MDVRVFFLFLIGIFLISGVSAGNLTIEKTKVSDIVIAEIGNPAVFDFVITNEGERDNFEIYSLAGVSMSPKGTFILEPGKNTLEVRAYPNKDLRKNSGGYNFEYQIRGQKSGITADIMKIKIVELKNVFELKVGDILPGDSEVRIEIENLQNTNLEDIDVRFVSVFFNFIDKVSLRPFESANFTGIIDQENIRGLVAGQYIAIAEFEVEGVEAETEGIVHYLEREGVKVERAESGIVVQRDSIKKINDGNIPTTVKIEMSKNILSRLFTLFSEEPTKVERRGLIVHYEWEKEIVPTEFFEVEASTNYTFPFILIVLIVVIVIFVKVYTRKVVLLGKTVSFVKTKGGEFALKVNLKIKAKKGVSDVLIIDSLPSMTKLYEGFGKKPDKIDEEKRRLFWNIGKMNAGEERVISYVIYSKLRIVGRFELPAAQGVYVADKEKNVVMSNRAFFVAESGSLGEG
tara:strand:+ start:1360 stop:2739 length:1380 start_codon:yes stop_codon:yes gene_type:complete